MYSGDDFYCDEVLSGRITVDVVFDSSDVLAFHHTRPFWPVHIVVVPRQHISSLLDPSVDAVLQPLFAAVQQVSRNVVDRHGACRVITNLGDYQDSKHLHVHVSYGDPLR